MGPNPRGIVFSFCTDDPNYTLFCGGVNCLLRTCFNFADNVGLHIDGVLYVRVDDPFKASYGVEDPEYAVTQLAQTTMRSEIGLCS